MTSFKNALPKSMIARLRWGNPDRVVEHLLATEVCDAPACERAVIDAAIAAERRLREFPEDVQLRSLLWGLEHAEGRVRTACASYLLHCKDPQVTEAVRRHLDDPEPGVTMRAKTHLRLYGETTP